MTVSTWKKSQCHKLYQRKSLLAHFKPKSHSYRSTKKLERKSRIRHLIRNLHQAYQSVSLIVTVIFRLVAFIDQFIRRIYTFVEHIVQIIRVIYGWVQLIRAIFSALHLIISRLMFFSFHIQRLLHLLSILFRPISNRTFEKSLRNFSHFLFHYYSSNGPCYTLQARTRHIAGRVKDQWTKNYRHIDEDIYYDTFEEELNWI